MKIGSVTADLSVVPDKAKNKKALKEMEKELHTSVGKGTSFKNNQGFKKSFKGVGSSLGEAITVGMTTGASVGRVGGIIGSAIGVVVGSVIVSTLKAQLDKSLEIVKSIENRQETYERLRAIGFSLKEVQQLQRSAIQHQVQPDKLNDFFKDIDQDVGQARVDPTSNFALMFRRLNIDIKNRKTSDIIQDLINTISSQPLQDQLGIAKLFSGGVESNVLQYLTKNSFKDIFKIKGTFLSEGEYERALQNASNLQIAQLDENTRELKYFANNVKETNNAITTSIQLQSLAFDTLTKTTVELNNQFQNMLNPTNQQMKALNDVDYSGKVIDWFYQAFNRYNKYNPIRRLDPFYHSTDNFSGSN